MGLLDFFARRKALTASPAAVEAIHNGHSTYQRLGGVNQQVNAAWLQSQSANYAFMYERQPAVRKVVDYIARNAAQLGLKLYERVSDTERERDTDHPAAETMEHPNDLGPASQFIFNFIADFLVHDNAYALKFPGARNTRTLVQVPPTAVMILGAARFSVEGYRIYRADGSMWPDYGDPPIAPESMIHWRSYNPSDPRIGISKLETLRQLLAEEAAAQAASTELYKSGLAAPGYIKRPLDAPPWSEEARQRFQESWANMNKSAPRKTPILEEDMEFADFGVSPKDAQMLEARRVAADEVASLYGMEHCPPQDEEERKQFYADVIAPLTSQLAEQLDFSLLRGEYQETDYYFEFDLNEKLRGDLEGRFQAITASVGAPWLTRNEARARENLSAIDGGDELITPLNVVEGNNPRPAPNVMPPQDPNGPNQDGSFREASASEEIRAIENGNRAVLEQKASHLLPRRAALARRRAADAGEHTKVLTSLFTRQEQVTKSKGHAKALDSERWNEELAADLLVLARVIVAREGGIAAARMASDFDLAQTHNYLIEKTRQQAEGINGATADDVATMGLKDAIARAKNVRAPNGGKALATGLVAFSTREAVKQTGSTHRVAISGGECPECAPYQGTWAPAELDAWPPYHANCNCLVDVAA